MIYIIGDQVFYFKTLENRIERAALTSLAVQSWHVKKSKSSKKSVELPD